ncbi:polysaccharide lyase family protein [Desertihabitans aurantiacus]|uniref:polysaccharide lyase family protein n=1 Tax=Desertihabitans aurantiacus TaxID=2282477 RepID=UPI000DF75A76|nr:polysaccharide lyase family protein [Desertihabitans aurantiacus]
MSQNPAVVTGLQTEQSITRTTLSWRSLGFEPLIDHYRVHAVRGAERDFEPTEDNLVGKTVYPRFEHDGLDPLGETWTYRVLARSDAGRLGRPSRPVSATSTPSVVGTGTPVAVVGAFDGRTLEHRFAPAGYAQIPVEHPDAVVEYVQGRDTPGTAWPYLLPGPGDSWAGRKVYRARWTFELSGAPTDSDLAIWLVDTTRLGGVLQVLLNGSALTSIELPAGATRGSREGDATVPGSTLRRCYFEPEVPADRLRTGANTVELVLAEGGWVAWDAVGLFARP